VSGVHRAWIVNEGIVVVYEWRAVAVPDSLYVFIGVRGDVAVDSQTQIEVFVLEAAVWTARVYVLGGVGSQGRNVSLCSRSTHRIMELGSGSSVDSWMRPPVISVISVISRIEPVVSASRSLVELHGIAPSLACYLPGRRRHVRLDELLGAGSFAVSCR